MDPSSSSLSSPCKRKRDSDSLDDEPTYKKPKNDLFINYSHEDIGKGFISHFKGALKLNSFVISDHTLFPATGEDMCLELLKAIQESEIFVVVFSVNYASSVGCLDELVNLMDCFQKFPEKRKFFPVFFKVEPSDVRNQEGPFLEAFQAHQTNVDPHRLQKWKQVLKEVGQKSGVALQKYGDEAEFVREIVEELQKMQCPQGLYVTKHPVGIGSRADELISKLRLDCKDQVLVVAVSGISGIGKTTIVKETYNRIVAKFSVSCFMADIHGICQVPNWKIKLPKMFLSCLTRDDKYPIMHSHTDAVSKIQRFVKGKRVLLVLDDVDNFQQLKALGINHSEWFGEGSRIIVTTRDEMSLGNMIPHESYVTRLLNRRESLYLFTQLMLVGGDDDPAVNTNLIEQVVNHAGGIPLVLRVWSRHFKEYKREEWPSVLKRLKRIPHGDVHKQLKMSYDSLTSEAKELFLDIACFFRYPPNKKYLVLKVLEDGVNNYFPEDHLRVLVNRSLVGIEGPEFRLEMHHTIREMGQEIVRQENQAEAGRRTRLWDERVVMRVLTECSGSESVKSIRLMIVETEGKVTLPLEGLRKMINLRLIYIDGGVDQLFWSNSSHDEMTAPLSFKRLIYMHWRDFPFKSINSNIDMGNHVVVLRLKHSKLETLWEGKGRKSLKNLRILEVGGSSLLTKTGDFVGLENLEELSFYGCDNLKELDTSIDCLHKLIILDLTFCLSLKMIPWEMICKLPSLRELRLSSLYEHARLCQLHNLKKIKLTYGGNNIRSIPNLPRNITHIDANDCDSLVNLPSNISSLTSLTHLLFDDCPKLGYEDPLFFKKLRGLTNLSYLEMNKCGVSKVPSEIGNLVSLVEINLLGNKFRTLPDSLSNLYQLKCLNIKYCVQLRSLPLLPSNLEFLEAIGCESLNLMSFYPKYFTRCIPHTKACKESSFSKPLMITHECKKKEIPDWFTYRNKGAFLSLVAPAHLDNKICGFILYAHGRITQAPKLLNKTKNTSRCLEELKLKCYYPMILFYSYMIMFYPLDDTTLVMEAGDTMTIDFAPNLVSECKLRLIYDCDMMDSKLVLQNVNGTPHDTIGDYDSDWDHDSDDDPTLNLVENSASQHDSDWDHDSDDYDSA